MLSDTKITVVTDMPESTFTLSIFDFVYAYDQLLNGAPTYQTGFDIKIATETDFSNDRVHILIVNYKTKYIPPDVDKFDLILVDNGDEPTSVLTNELCDLIEQNINAYLVTASIVAEQHRLYNKIISRFGDWTNTLQYWVNPCYPMKYQIEEYQNSTKSGVCFINGANRLHRDYTLKLVCSKNILTVNNYSKLEVTPILYQSSSREDKIFYEWLSGVYCNEFIPSPEYSEYYNNSVPIGQAGKFLKIPPGYFLIEQYKQYKCIAFPETEWKNNELSVTEKSLKCFITGIIPFPFAGANAGLLYNKIGFQTAIDLLPNNLKFDHILNHSERILRAVNALEWLNTHQEILHSTQADAIIKNNYENFFNSYYINYTVKQLHNIICNYKNEI